MDSKQSLLRQVQLTELICLKDIDRLCREHHIRYSLYCGTLLGCIRHRGFIPWDDDADIMMPLQDYYRFRRLAEKELSERYFLSDHHSDPYATTAWLKLNRKGTLYCTKEERKSRVDKGISLDVYPLVGAYEGVLGKLQTKALLFQKAMVGKELRQSADYAMVTRYEGMLRLLDRLPAALRRGLCILIEKLFWPDPAKHKNCGTVDAADFAGKYRTRDWDETADGEFEGCTFPIPREYDRFLKRMYGNYREMPPAEKRVNHHAEDAVIELSDDVAEEIRNEL